MINSYNDFVVSAAAYVENTPALLYVLWTAFLFFLYGIIAPLATPLTTLGTMLFVIFLVFFYARSIILNFIPLAFGIANIILLVFIPTEKLAPISLAYELVGFNLLFFAMTALWFPFAAVAISAFKEKTIKKWYLIFYVIYFLIAMGMFSSDNIIYFLPTT